MAALFENAFQCKEIKFGNFISFEFLNFILKGGPKFSFLTIYRPPRFSVNSINDFAELM